MIMADTSDELLSWRTIMSREYVASQFKKQENKTN